MAIYELEGIKPELPSDGVYWVADTAAVIGRVRLCSDVSVWYGSVLRGDNEWIEIGERSDIQDNCTLHTDPGFPLTVGANTLVGHNVVVGAGALITEGKSFPDNSLIVGSPAKAVRTLDDKAIARIAHGVDVYV